MLLAVSGEGAWFDTWAAYTLLAFLLLPFRIEVECVFCTDTRVGLYFIVRSSAKREIKKNKRSLYFIVLAISFSRVTVTLSSPSLNHVLLFII